MVVIGGGVIGLELGSVWRRLGAKVTVVEFLDQILPGMDGDVRKEANKMFKKQGFEFRLSTKVTKAERKGDTRHADRRARGRRRGRNASRPTSCSSRSAAAEHRRARPRQGRARAQQARPDRNRPRFPHQGPGIWAIGDVIPGPMLAHKAEDEGIAVAENIAGQTGS